jgi:CPA2 family monovalent cation:H+ antiporter-2
LIVSASLAQIGEFSFILAGLSVAIGLFTHENQNIILAAAIISIALNPFIFRLIQPIQSQIRARSKLARALERSHDPLAELPMNEETAQIGGHIVLVGYGRVGQRIANALIKHKITFVVAEQNREHVEKLRQQGLHAVAGDASEAAVIIQAHIARADTLVVAISDTFRTRRMIEMARMLNPSIKTLVRTHSDEEVALLQSENATRVFFGEHELAQSMIEYLITGQNRHENQQ